MNRHRFSFLPCLFPFVALSLAGVLRAETALPNTGTIAPQLQHYVDEHELAGAVTLVASPDQILDCETVGWQDIAAHERMRPDSLFWIASQSKPITATALMILVDEGKVKLDDPVEKYVPEFKDIWAPDKSAAAAPGEVHLKRPRHPIMVREILSHTSGLPFSSAIEKPTLDLFPLEARVRSYTIAPLLFEPGTSYQYANAGINTAGRIVEVVSGMPLEKFLEERIFIPLGMKDTTFYPTAQQLTRLAKSYAAVKGQLKETPISQLKYPLDGSGRYPMPAGGLFSTAQDLSLFYRMLAHGGELNGKRIVSTNAVQQMTSKQTGDLPNPYGFAFSVNGAKFGHGGAYGTNSEYNGGQKLITIFLVQHASWGPHGKDILPAFRRMAFDKFGHH